MCERTYCRHEHEKLCSCPPVTCRDALGMAAHLAENMEKVRWSLNYNSLKDIKPYQLCLVGKCRICGGRLCMEQRRVEADSTDGFLAAVAPIPRMNARSILTIWNGCVKAAKQICTEPYHTCRKNFRSCDIRRNGQEKFCWRGSAHFERRRRIQNAEALPDSSGCTFLSVGAGAESET